MIHITKGRFIQNRRVLRRAKNAVVAAAFISLQVLSPIATFFIISSPTLAHADSTVAPASNPTLAQACGLDIAIVIDNSNSITDGSYGSPNEMGQIKTAMTGFTNALSGTPTQFSVTRFGTTAHVVNPFTASIAATNAAINGISAGGGGTNWEDGLVKAKSTFDPRADKPNLIIFASDGNPTYHNDNSYNGIGGNGSSTSQADIDNAVTQANVIKSAGTRILALGIGNELDVNNLKAISGPNQDTGNVLTSDVITSSFSTLAADLANFAKQTCGGTITTTKLIDADGNLGTTNDQTPASGWTFDVDGTASNPGSTTTDATGKTPAVKVSSGTYSVNETQQAGYELLGASCIGASSNGGRQGNGVLSVVVGDQDIVSCTFINTPSKGAVKVDKKVDGDGDGIYEGGNSEANTLGLSWTLDGSGTNAMGSTVSDITAGSHNVSENNATGYHFTGWYPTANTQQQSCSNPQSTSLPVPVTVSSGQTTEITLCNARDTGTLKVKKSVINNNGGDANAKDFNLHVKQGGVDVNNSPAAGSASGTSYTLPTGTYTVSEDTKAGYSQTNLACVDLANSQSVSYPVVLSVNQNVVCTITNDDIAPTVTVTKNVLNPYGSPLSPSAFPLFIDATSVTSGTSYTQFNAGVHTISETQHSGYSFTSVSGDCAINNDIISLLLSLDGHANCMLTNTAVQPKLIVKKKVINDNSGKSNPEDFTITVTGNPVVVPSFPGSSAGTAVGLNEGSYSVGEVSHVGYTQTLSDDCTGTIHIGETKTCYITNDDIPHPSIKVVKSGPTTAHEGDNIVYNFTVTNTGDTTLSDIGIDDDIAINETCNDNYLAPSASTHCTASYTIPTPQVADVTNNVIASGTDPDETTVTAQDSHTLDVLHSSIKVVKSGPASALAGSTVTYTFTITNTGEEAVGELKVTDSITGAGTYVSGDTNNNGLLDLAETWVYTSNYLIPASQTASVINTVSVCGYTPQPDDDVVLYRLNLVDIDPQQDNRTPVCAQDSHTLSVGHVLSSTTTTTPTPAVLAVTGQGYAKVMSVIAFISATFLVAVLALAPRKQENQ